MYASSERLVAADGDGITYHSYCFNPGYIS